MGKGSNVKILSDLKQIEANQITLLELYENLNEKIDYLIEVFEENKQYAESLTDEGQLFDILNQGLAELSGMDVDSVIEEEIEPYKIEDYNQPPNIPDLEEEE